MGAQTTYYYLQDFFGINNLNGVNVMSLSSLGLGGTDTGISTTQSAAAFAVFGCGELLSNCKTINLIADRHHSI